MRYMCVCIYCVYIKSTYTYRKKYMCTQHVCIYVVFVGDIYLTDIFTYINLKYMGPISALHIPQNITPFFETKSPD